MNIFGGFFNRAVSGQTGASIPEIYPFKLKCNEFIRADIHATYRKILLDVIERTHGLKDEYEAHLWDNCVVSESPEGLINLLVQAMYDKADLFIYYKKSVNILRKATSDEARQIEDDYKNNNTSSIGIYVSFKNFTTTDLLRIFSELQFYVLSGLYKNVNLSKAVQFKMSELRSSVANIDADVVVAQAKEVALALSRGDDVLVDAGDSLEQAKPEMGPTESAIAFLNQQRAFYLGFPMSYISGIQTGGLSTTGEGDTKAIERGLKPFFKSIIRPILESLFDVDVTFRSSDFREIASALETLSTFELVSDTALSRQSKDAIIATMFDLDPEQEKKFKAEEAAKRGSDTTLNGAQTTAMSQFLGQLAQGQLAPETAISALMVSFSLSREDAEAIVRPMIGFTPRADV